MLKVYYWNNIPYQRSPREGTYYSDMWMIYYGDQTLNKNDQITLRLNPTDAPENYYTLKGTVTNVLKSTSIRNDDVFDTVVYVINCTSSENPNQYMIHEHEVEYIINYILTPKLSDTFNFWVGNPDVVDDENVPIFGIFPETELDKNFAADLEQSYVYYLDTMENKKIGLDLDKILKTDFFKSS